MVDHILEQDKVIRRVLCEDRKASHLVLTWQDADALTSLHKALEPFADFTDALSDDSSRVTSHKHLKMPPRGWIPATKQRI